MTQHRYPLDAVVGDYLRAGVGLALTAGPAALAPLDSPVQYVLLPLAVLFAMFAVRTGRRHGARVEIARDTLSLFQPRQVSLSIGNVKSVKLSYYSTKTDRAGGWMQLTLDGAGGPRGGTIRVDSGLEGFADVARWAAAAARVNGIELSRATLANLGALGIEVDGPK